MQEMLKRYTTEENCDEMAQSDKVENVFVTFELVSHIYDFWIGLRSILLTRFVLCVQYMYCHSGDPLYQAINWSVDSFFNKEIK